ncbi:MAG: sigma-70 family RNA polymerase sigma factor [Phycisphaerales bacterium]
MPSMRPSSRDVFEILVREHADMLCAFLRSLVARDDLVDDLFQETMLVAWRRLGDYDRSRPFGPWLRGIAVRLVLAQRRRSGRDLLACDPQVLEAMERHIGAFELVPADSFRARAERVRSCVDRLPALLRDVIELGYERGLMLSHIAAALDVSEEAVKKRMQRARLLVATCLQARSAAIETAHGEPA